MLNDDPGSKARQPFFECQPMRRRGVCVPLEEGRRCMIRPIYGRQGAGDKKRDVICKNSLGQRGTIGCWQAGQIANVKAKEDPVSPRIHQESENVGRRARTRSGRRLKDMRARRKGKAGKERRQRT